MLKETYDRLLQKIDTGDSSYLKSVTMLNSQTKKMSEGVLTSALMKFGKASYKPLKSSKIASNLMKRVQNSKISVQPTSVQRRRMDHEEHYLMAKAHLSYQ